MLKLSTALMALLCAGVVLTLPLSLSDVWESAS
jgi:hypothetical protein